MIFASVSLELKGTIKVIHRRGLQSNEFRNSRTQFVIRGLPFWLVKGALNNVR